MSVTKTPDDTTHIRRTTARALTAATPDWEWACGTGRRASSEALSTRGETYQEGRASDLKVAISGPGVAMTTPMTRAQASSMLVRWTAMEQTRLRQTKTPSLRCTALPLQPVARLTPVTFLDLQGLSPSIQEPITRSPPPPISPTRPRHLPTTPTPQTIRLANFTPLPRRRHTCPHLYRRQRTALLTPSPCRGRQRPLQVANRAFPAQSRP